MSWVTSVVLWVALFVNLAVSGMGAWMAATGDGGVGWVLLAIGSFCLVFLVANLVPYLEVRSSGVFVRNAIWGYWIPWVHVVDIVPTSRVTLVLDDHRHIKPYAVQNANLTLMLKRRGRVERTIDRLNPLWSTATGTGAADDGTDQRIMLAPAWTVVGYVLFLALIFGAAIGNW